MSLLIFTVIFSTTCHEECVFAEVFGGGGGGGGGRILTMVFCSQMNDELYSFYRDHKFFNFFKVVLTGQK